MGIWQETGLSIKLHYCKPSKEPVASHNRTWIITTIVVKLPKTTHLIRDEKHIVYLTCGSRIFPRSGKGKMLFAGEGWEWGRWSLGLCLVTMLYRVCECNVSLNWSLIKKCPGWLWCQEWRYKWLRNGEMLLSAVDKKLLSVNMFYGPPFWRAQQQLHMIPCNIVNLVIF